MGVSVRHNSKVAALVALIAAVVTVAWFSRALQTGSLMDWFWCLVVAAVGLVQLLVVRDSRAPLMVADEHGVRVRHGETWSGLRWHDIEHVEVQSPGSWLRDGRIIVHPRVHVSGEQPARDGADTQADGIHEGGASTPGAAAYVVPLARTTRLEFDGLTGDLVADLDALASGQAPVLVLTRTVHEKAEQVETGVEVHGHEQAARTLQTEHLEHETPESASAEAPESEPEPEPDYVSGTGAHSDAESGTPTGAASLRKGLRERWAGLRRRKEAVAAAEDGTEQGDEHEDEHDLQAGLADVEPETETETETETQAEFDPVDPARAARPAARSEALHDSVRRLPVQPAIPAQRAGDGPVVVARMDQLDDYSGDRPQPVADPVIGPLIIAARNRARLSIDVLSERTRIRPHVLECIEVDDFEACGGDFYARGHLRTLARVFGLDTQQLLDLYDDRYARAEIEARQVFEAELASGIGGGVRTAHTGPRWSLLAACVLALASVWGVARVFNDTPQELVSPAPEVVDSAGLAKSTSKQVSGSALAPLQVKATGASPQVVVRDRDGRILWSGRLADGSNQQVIGTAPFEVTASNGEAVQVSFLGRPKGSVGDSQAAGSRQFG